MNNTILTTNQCIDWCNSYIEKSPILSSGLSYVETLFIMILLFGYVAFLSEHKFKNYFLMTIIVVIALFLFF